MQKTELFDKQKRLIHSKESIYVYVASDEFIDVKGIISKSDQNKYSLSLS